MFTIRTALLVCNSNILEDALAFSESSGFIFSGRSIQICASLDFNTSLMFTFAGNFSVKNNL